MQALNAAIAAKTAWAPILRGQAVPLGVVHGYRADRCDAGVAGSGAAPPGCGPGLARPQRSAHHGCGSADWWAY
jgi:hypothetical protein